MSIIFKTNLKGKNSSIYNYNNFKGINMFAREVFSQFYFLRMHLSKQVLSELLS